MESALCKASTLPHFFLKLIADPFEILEVMLCCFHMENYLVKVDPFATCQIFL